MASVRMLRRHTGQCPPGTEMSLVTWIGTCQNPADGKHYAISYNDCCGKSAVRPLLLQPERARSAVAHSVSGERLQLVLGQHQGQRCCTTARRRRIVGEAK